MHRESIGADMNNLEKLRLATHGLPIAEDVGRDVSGSDEPEVEPERSGMTASEYNRARQILANAVGYVHDASDAMRQLKEDPSCGAPVEQLLGQAQRCIEAVRRMRGGKR